MREHAPLVIAQGTEVRGFLIESKLGAGGFGTVFRASRGERRYALKFIRHGDAGGWAKREVEMLLRTSHRNVVGFEGCGFWPDDTREYLVVIQEVREKESQLHQCQADYTRLSGEQQGPRGLAGLLTAGLLDQKGIVTRNISKSLRESPGNVATVVEGHSYRSASAIMVVLKLEPLPGMELWRAARAVLEGPGRRKPRVSTLWQPEPLQPGVPNLRVVIEAEATEEESRGSFTLKVTNEDGTRSIAVSGVTFP